MLLQHRKHVVWFGKCLAVTIVNQVLKIPTKNFQAIDKVGYPTCFSLAGNLMFLITFSFVGPVSFIPIEPAEHLIQVLDNPDA